MLHSVLNDRERRGGKKQSMGGAPERGESAVCDLMFGLRFTAEGLSHTSVKAPASELESSQSRAPERAERCPDKGSSSHWARKQGRPQPGHPARAPAFALLR